MPKYIDSFPCSPLRRSTTLGSGIVEYPVCLLHLISRLFSSVSFFYKLRETVVLIACLPQAEPRRDGSPRDTPSVVMCLLAIAAVMQVGANEGGEILPPHAPVEAPK